MSEKWIPVAERLPGRDCIGKCILVTVGNDVIPVRVLDGINWGRGVWDFDNYSEALGEEAEFYHWREITAWMPLPDPYTEDKS